MRRVYGLGLRLNRVILLLDDDDDNYMILCKYGAIYYVQVQVLQLKDDAVDEEDFCCQPAAAVCGKMKDKRLLTRTIQIHHTL